MNFKKLDSYLGTLPREHNVDIYGCAVHINGKKVFRAGNDTPDNNFFHLYSASKLFTAVSALQLIEQDRLGLYSKVSDYLPAFKDLSYLKDGVPVRCETPLLIWHLLTMSGGFDYDDDFDAMHRLVDGRDRIPSEQVLSLLAQKPLSFEPGTHYQYSLGLDILGAVIEKISGKSLDEYLSENILKPLGIREITFWPSKTQYARMSEQRFAGDTVTLCGKENVFLSARHFASGGSGLCGTVDEYIRFLDALSNNGADYSGKRILRPETISLLGTPMLTGAGQREFQAMKTDAYQYTMGMRTRILPPGVGAFGWDGAAGAYALADPSSHLSIFFAAHLLNYPTFYEVIHPQLRSLIYEAISE